MLSAYSWGQFWTFILVLVAVYYVVVGLLYYRQEMAALFTRAPKGGSGATESAAPVPSLVQTKAVFAPPAAPEEAAATTPEAAPVAPVNGELPVQTTQAGIPVAADTPEVLPATAAASAADEQRPDAEEDPGLHGELAQKVRQQMRQEAPTPELAEAEPAADDIAKSNSSEHFIAETSIGAEEGQPLYAPSDFAPLSLVMFDEPVLSLPATAEGDAPVEDVDAPVPATALLSYIQGLLNDEAAVDGGPQAAAPVAPVALSGTVLAAQLEEDFALAKVDSSAELDALFGNEI